MVARIANRLGELLDGDVGRGDIGVAEGEVDHVLAAAARVHLESIDVRHHVRRQTGDAPELHECGGYRTRSAA